MLITGCVCILECIFDLSATAFKKNYNDNRPIGK